MSLAPNVITYDRDERWIALGYASGMIDVAEVAPDGAPARSVARIFAHRKPVTCVGFGAERVASLDEAGRVVITALPSGDAVHRLELGGEYASGAMSPDGGTLFVFVWRRADTNVFAIDLATGHLSYGPKVRALSVQSRVLPLGPRRAAFQYLHEQKGSPVREALAIVDFDSGKIDLRPFANGPRNTFGDLPPIAVGGGIGVRLGWGDPIEIEEIGGEPHGVISLEVFDAATGARVRAVPALRSKLDERDHETLAAGPGEDGDDHARCVARLHERITALALTEDGARAWLALAGGAVRAIDPTDGRRGPIVLHGHLGDRAAPAGDGALGVAPRGTFVGFGAPAEFFRAAEIDLARNEPVRLPPRPVDGGESPPRSIELVDEGRALAIVTGGGFLLADAATGAPRAAFEVPYGDSLRSASVRGEELVLAYAARSSLRVRLSDGEAEVVELPVPPNVVFAEHVGDGVVALAHDQGAIVVLEGDELQAFRWSEPDEEEEDEDEDEDEEAEADEPSSSDDEGDEASSSDDEDESEAESEAEAESEDAERAPAVGWTVKNPDGVLPLEFVENFEGRFIYNDYFEQADPVLAVTSARVDDRRWVLTLREGGSLDAYELGADRIHHRASYTNSHARRGFGHGHHVALGGGGGEIEVLELGAGGITRALAFTAPGVRPIGWTRDRGLLLYDDDRGVGSRLDIASRTERALFAYHGPAIAALRVDAGSGQACLIESSGTVLVFAIDAAAGARAWRVVGGELTTGEPIGRLTEAHAPIERRFLTADELSRGDDDDDERLGLVAPHRRAGTTRRFERDVERMLERYRELGEGDAARKGALLAGVLAPFDADASIASALRKAARAELGRCYTLRGCLARDAGDLAAAAADFDRGAAAGYGRGLEERMLLAAFGEHDPAAVLRIADRLLVDFDTKQSIGLRKSLGVHRAILAAELDTGDERAAETHVELVAGELWPYLRQSDDNGDDGDGGDRALQPMIDDLARRGDALADRLRARLEAAAAAPEPPDDDATSAQLQAALGHARFLTMNTRWREAREHLDDALAPYQRDVPPAVVSRAGDLFAVRGRVRAAEGDLAGAAADAVRAYHLHDPASYRAAMQAHLALGDAAAAQRDFSHFVANPFNWPSEFFTPVDRAGHAALLALRAVAVVLAGGAVDVALCRALYAPELDAARACVEGVAGASASAAAVVRAAL